MSRSLPYQPLLLRLLHGATALLSILAIAAACLVYNTYDGRFLHLPLPQIPDIIGIHGTFGLLLLLVMPLFALYSFHPGQHRLIQPDSLKQISQLTQLGRPIWWYSLQRVVNTVMLIAVTFSLISGRMMKEEWLPAGQLDHSWYRLHVVGWIVLVICLAIHLLLGAKVGGLALFRSMVAWGWRADDAPTLWWSRVQQWLRHIGRRDSSD